MDVKITIDGEEALTVEGFAALHGKSRESVNFGIQTKRIDSILFTAIRLIKKSHPWPVDLRKKENRKPVKAA